MKVLVAPDKFKGSLSAAAAAEAIARGWKMAAPGDAAILAPIADGGEGFAEAICLANGGEWVTTKARDPLGREVEARYAWIEQEKRAVIEMCEASGMWRLGTGERAPLEANTFGTGQLIRHAAERGAASILVGLGGSATTDGGAGMAAALGYDLYTSDGEPLAPLPRHFLALTRIGCRNAIPLPEVIAACDVQNPLLGERGTARIFSPQKGATPSDVETLEACLENFADVVAEELGCDHRDQPGAGAAGGIGFGLMSFCQARVESGFDLVACAIHLEELVKEADLVITGEGRLDGQTSEGKGPAGVAALARRHAKPILALGGSIDRGADLSAHFDAVLPMVDTPMPLEEAVRHAELLLVNASTRAARLLHLGAGLRAKS